MLISARLCWMYSFIGSDSIWPVPPCAMMILALSGLALLYGVCAISARAAGRSYLMSNVGLPNQGLVASIWPLAGVAWPLRSLTISSRLIARLAALRMRMSVHGEP